MSRLRQAIEQEPEYDFSLVLGGPLYQLLRRTGLADDTLALLRRRILVACSLTWLPLLILSAWEGRAWGGTVAMPFLRDVEVHVRLLAALPLLLVAELVVHLRMRPLARQFLDRGLVPEAARPQFDAAIDRARRLRNSIPAELLLIALVYGVGVLFLWRSYMAIPVTSWYGEGAAARLQPSLAGWWYGCVSLPLFQFLLLRWYFRLVVWSVFLWRVSRIELALMPTHPDRAGGLGFLSNISYAFAPLLVAQGCLLAGMIANRIFFTGAKLPQFRVEAAALIAFMLMAVLGPMLVFTRRLEQAKRVGLREYGTLAQRYTRDFDEKWLRGGAPPGEPLLGSADIQSLADLGNSYEVIKEMRLIPFTPRTILQLSVVTLLPLLPLTLTMISLDELVQRMLQMVF